MKSLIALTTVMLLAYPALAQTPAAGAPPRPSASKDPTSAPAGNYTLDARHASIIARVGHMGGVSFSTFRFDKSSGTLVWNGAKPEASQLSITVDMTSINSPVPNFASELIGDRFLKTGQFPTAKFVSTSVQRTGPTTGKIAGNMTFMGVTKPMTIDATLVGTGTNRQGPVIGFSGEAHFKRSDFGFSSMVGPIADDIQLVIDVEFDKAA